MNLPVAGESSKLAFITPEHFYPLLYVLGASDGDDAITIFNDSRTLGSISMTSYLIAEKNRPIIRKIYNQKKTMERV